MRIAIEAQRIFRSNKHGMDFVVLEMVKQLQQIDHINEYHILVSPGEDHCIQETENFHIHELRMPSYPLWEQVALPCALRRIKPDILHCTSNTAPICCNVPLILTLHDIIFLEKRDSSNKSLYQNLGWYYRRLVVPRILKKCKTIITVSHFEKENICNRIPSLPQERVRAVYNGFSQHFSPVSQPQEIIKKYTDAPCYFFFLGNTDPKKNTKRVLRAYNIYMQQSKKKAQLLVADLKQEIINQYLDELNLSDLKTQIRASGYIVNTDLPALYSGAHAFLYPSLRESFGIPLLEAMACGTPVISSNISAIPEIAGDGAALIDPFDEKQLAEMMLRMDSDESFRKELITYGLDRVKQFSWKNTAENVLTLYKELGEKTK